LFLFFSYISTSPTVSAAESKSCGLNHSLKKTIQDLKPVAAEDVEEEELDEEALAQKAEREQRVSVKPKFKEGNTVLVRHRLERDGQPTAMRVYVQVLVNSIAVTGKSTSRAKLQHALCIHPAVAATPAHCGRGGAGAGRLRCRA
jgi:hypothetical protein